MIRVGVTGGIGAGKSKVCSVFESFNISVYNSDERSKVLVQQDESIIRALRNEFGQEIYNKDNVLNKERLASIVFNDNQALNFLNNIVHPVVIKDFNEWCKLHDHEKYIVKESALVFESGSFKQLDYVILVFAPENIRIERIMKREGMLQDEVMMRMRNQWSDEEKIMHSHFVIHSYGGHNLLSQVRKIHEYLMDI